MGRAGDVLVHDLLGGAVGGDGGQGRVHLVQQVRVLLGNGDGVVLNGVLGVQDLQLDLLLTAGGQAQDHGQGENCSNKLFHTDCFLSNMQVVSTRIAQRRASPG